MVLLIFKNSVFHKLSDEIVIVLGEKERCEIRWESLGESLGEILSKQWNPTVMMTSYHGEKLRYFPMTCAA